MNALADNSILTTNASQYLDNLAAELDVSPERYEEAERRYKSVGEWLGRDASTLRDLDPEVYVQGSFRQGTPVRPINGTEHYDIDLICELKAAGKSISQQRLKELVGDEMQLYAKAHGMENVQESRRCWTLEYADGAQFHLDALPAIPDANRQMRLLKERNLSTEWSQTALAITDNEHPNYAFVHEDWPRSNPKGFTDWFRSRMRTVFDARRGAMALEAKASVEDIPSYKVKTPLQRAVQILKRHRDLMFANDPANKPISVIITTLAGRAYGNEVTVALALGAILASMDKFIQYDKWGNAVVLNPADPTENFADRWQQYPERKTAFFEWLARVRRDFQYLSAQRDRQLLVEAGERFAGPRTARAAVVPTTRVSRVMSFARASLLSATHKQRAPWPAVKRGNVSISDATWRAKGFSRPIRFYSDSEPLPKNASLRFQATTDIPQPYDVHWQIVNTGDEATIAGGLRGGFDRGVVEPGAPVRNESTAYSGSHTIECFIVKDGHLVARSGVFVVNIR